MVTRGSAVAGTRRGPATEYTIAQPSAPHHQQQHTALGSVMGSYTQMNTRMSHVWSWAVLKWGSGVRAKTAQRSAGMEGIVDSVYIQSAVSCMVQ